jgi:hypothetical protein
MGLKWIIVDGAADSSVYDGFGFVVAVAIGIVSVDC